MKVYRTKIGIVVESSQKYYKLQDTQWDAFINAPGLYGYLEGEIQTATVLEKLDSQDILAPIVSQEVWASGVTYLRSKTARMEESKDAGGGDFYDRVYDAERPEIFFKATASRTVGSGDAVRIRKDSEWNVPEPELTLFVNNAGEIAGYTVGNDMSSRDIEGENPLYLPQAKSYDKSAAIGPCILIMKEGLPLESKINIEIHRGNELKFEGETTLHQMKRKLPELVHYLTLECSFPYGTFLMTGTGIVPPDSFTLRSGDQISIRIDHIGTLVNTVE
ncbi:MAG: fumarylacetoacetate hydrolase family protein [Leadbetterella sp.]